MIAVVSIASLKVIQRSPFRQYSCSKTVQTSSTTLSSPFLKWSEKWFDTEKRTYKSQDCLSAPVFYCDSKDIDVLKEPKQFYRKLKVSDFFKKIPV